MELTRAIEIGELAPGEEPALLSLLSRCGLPVAGVEERLGDALVARREGSVVGSAVLELYREGALLRSVAVDERFRGSGLGTRLCEKALELARLRGSTRVFLLTESAGEFFTRFGFRPIERERVPVSVRGSVEFTSACPASAVVMEKAL